LEEEWLALIQAQEEAILALARRKEEILTKLSRLRGDRQVTAAGEETPEILQLQNQIAQRQRRNLSLINAGLEVIQDFLFQLNAASPGMYQGGGKVQTFPGTSFFHRHV
jgi:hypothetical protein